MRASFDTFRRDADVARGMEGIDSYTAQALGILTDSKLRDALDHSLEDPRIVARYGQSDVKFQRDGAPRMIENFCIARRLVEAGARYVALNYSRWDWHDGDGMNFPMSREEFPLLDQGLSALVTNLHERGLERDVSVVVWGEFGRTPRINKSNSPNKSTALTTGPSSMRRSWPSVACARGRSSANPTATARSRPSARCWSRRFLPRSITAWG